MSGGISSRAASESMRALFALGLKLIMSGFLGLVAIADSLVIFPLWAVDGTWIEYK